jgi:hypothetical protein
MKKNKKRYIWVINVGYCGCAGEDENGLQRRRESRKEKDHFANSIMCNVIQFM